MIRKKLGLLVSRYQAAKAVNTSLQVRALPFRHHLLSNNPELEKAHRLRRLALAAKLFGRRGAKFRGVKVNKSLRAYSMLCSRSDAFNRRAILLHGLVSELSEFYARMTNLEVTGPSRRLFRGIISKLKYTIRRTAELSALERWFRPRRSVIAAQDAKARKREPERRRRYNPKRAGWWNNRRGMVAQKIAERRAKKAQLTAPTTPVIQSQSGPSQRRFVLFKERGLSPAATCPTSEPSGLPSKEDMGVGPYYYRSYYKDDKKSYIEGTHWMGPKGFPDRAVRLDDPRAREFRIVPRRSSPLTTGPQRRKR